MSFNKDAALSDHFTLKIHLLCDSSCTGFNVREFESIFAKTSYNVNVTLLLQEELESNSKLLSLTNFFNKISTPCLFYDIMCESTISKKEEKVRPLLLTKHLHKSILFHINFIQGNPSPRQYEKRNGSALNLKHMIKEQMVIFQHNVYIDKVNVSRPIEFLHTSTTFVGETVLLSVIQRIVNRAIYCFIVNIMSYISNLKKHLLVEENKKLSGAQMTQKEKEIFCYIRKRIGDFYLFLGAPLFSLQMYSEIQEIVWKNSNSSWIAFCQESEAAAIYFYFLYIEQNSVDITNNVSSPRDTPSPRENLSTELEQILCDTTKFWTLHFPLNSKTTRSHFVEFLNDTTLINASPLVPLHRHFEEVSDLVFSTFKKRKNSLKIIGFIFMKLKEAYHIYDKFGSECRFLRLELLLKMIRLLVKTFNMKIILSRILCKFVDDLQEISSFLQQELYLSLANILLSYEMYRHYSFFIFQTVHLQIKRCVTLFSLQRLCETMPFLYLQDVLIYPTNKSLDNNVFCDFKTMDLHLYSLNDLFIRTIPMNSITLLLSSKFLHKDSTKYQFHLQHLNKIKLYENDACHLLWPRLQIIVFKTLVILYTTLQQFKQAAFIVYTLLSKCHRVFNLVHTSTCLHLLHQLSQQMHEPLQLPITLVVSSSNKNSVIKKSKRQPDKDFIQTKNTLLFYGGVTQGSCPPLPTLCRMRVCQSKRGYWCQNLTQDYYHTFHTTQVKEMDFLNLSLNNSMLSCPSQYLNTHAMTQKQIFTNSLHSNSQKKQECVWFVGEPVVLELQVRSTLNVPLHINAVHIQTLGAPLETKHVTFTLQPFSVQKIYVTVKPLKEESFWIIGATFHLYRIEIPILYLILNNDIVIKYFQFKETCTSQTENELLRSGSAIYGVIHSYPELYPRYYGDPIQHFHKTPFAHSSLVHPNTMILERQKTSPTQMKDNLFPIDSLYELVPSNLTDSGTLNFYLGLTNTSSTFSLHKVQLCCVQDLGENVQDFLYHEKKPYVPPDEWFFHYFHQEDFSTSEKCLPFLSIETQTSLKSTLPSSPFLKLEPLTLPHNSNTQSEIQDLQPKQTIYIHLHARLGEYLSQNAAIIVRYTSMESTNNARFLFLPISFPVITTPLLCILENSIDVQPKTSIDIQAVSKVVLQCFEFSDFVLSTLAQSMSSSNLLEAGGIFHKNEYKLDMKIMNNSSNSMYLLVPNLCLTSFTEECRTSLCYTRISCPPCSVSKCSMDLMLPSDLLHLNLENIPNSCENKRNCDILEEAIHRTLQYVCYEGNGVYLPLTLKMEPPFVPSTIHLSIPSVSKLKQYKIHPSSCSLPYQSHIYFSECTVNNSITGQLYHPQNMRVFHVPCFVPLNITFTLQRLKITNVVADKSSTDVVTQSSETQPTIRVILIPYETLYIKQKAMLQHQAASCKNNSILQYSYSRSYESCLWCGSLEKSVKVVDTTTVTFTLIMTSVGLTQTLFSAYVNENPLCFIWNTSSYVLISDNV